MIKLYADPITINCRKALAGFDLIGVPYELVHVDYFTGKQKEAAYLAINPNASIPAMTDGDFVLWESNSILQYAADKQGNDRAYPRDPKVRADINRWMFWESASWFPSCYVYLVENCVKPLLGSSTDQAVLEAQNEQFHKLASILEADPDDLLLQAKKSRIRSGSASSHAPMYSAGSPYLMIGDWMRCLRFLTKQAGRRVVRKNKSCLGPEADS